MMLVRNIYVLFLIEVPLSSQPQWGHGYLWFGGDIKFGVATHCEHLYCGY